MAKKIDCGGPSATYCRQRLCPVSVFDRRSFRTIKSGKARVVIGCPRGKYDARRDRCKVGTRAQTILHSMRSAKCRRACWRG